MRRDIDRLRDLGYPVASVRGPSGGQGAEWRTFRIDRISDLVIPGTTFHRRALPAIAAIAARPSPGNGLAAATLASA